MKMEIKARAKINLFLHVMGKAETGMHILESLAVFADDVFDSISIEHSNHEEILITGGEFRNFLDPKSNIISKASKTFNLPLCKYSLTKNIPIGAGLGGGSSDAAAVIRHFNCYTSNENLSVIGSDVPVCYHNKACFFEGTGEIVTDVKNFPVIHAVLINPKKELLTKDVFRKNTNKSTYGSIKILDFKNDTTLLFEFLNSQRNDLAHAAISIIPEISEILNLLEKQEGCIIARMSGSGATCFGLFSSKDHATFAADSIKRQSTEAWVKYTTLS